eukprot:evm.model.scf_1711.2 EVM.evm.TU.scf_1711.2   scf_1711:6710-10538(-)
MPLKIFQTASVMEVAHSVLGLVRSPVLFAVLQCAGRNFNLWGIVAQAPEQTTTAGVRLLSLGDWAVELNFITLVVAWSLGDVIRYAFFALKDSLTCTFTCYLSGRKRSLRSTRWGDSCAW